MLKLLFRLCFCVTLVFTQLVWNVQSETAVDYPKNGMGNVNQFLKTYFSSKNVNVFHGLNRNADLHDLTRENMLREILTQTQSHDEIQLGLSFQTFSIISSQANTSQLPKTWSLLTKMPYFHQQHTSCGSVNLILVDGNNRNPVFKVLTEFYDLMLIPAQDRTVIYQWKNYNEGILYASELRNLLFKLEIIPHPHGLAFKSLCFFCNKGEPLVVSLAYTTDKIEHLFPDTTRNLHGKVLKFSTSTGMPTMIDYKKTSNDSWDYFGGFMTPFLNTLKQRLNCSLTVHPIRGYGRLLENGTFNGVLGLVVGGHVDFGMAGQMYDGHLGVDYLHVVHPGTVVVSTKVPAGELRLHAIFQAFGYRAWWLMIAMCLGIILPFYAFLNRISAQFKSSKSESRSYTVQKGVKFIFYPLLEQNLTNKLVPSQHSGRCLLAFWLFTVLVITTAYKCKLRDLMIQSEPEYIPTTFNELAELPDYELYAQAFGGVLFYTFKLIQTPVYKNIARRLRPTDTMLECLESAIRRPKAVCINYDAVIERESNLYFTDRMGRPLIRISSSVTGAFSTVATLVVAKKDVLRNTLNSFTSVQYSMGLTQHGRLVDVRESASKGKAMANARNASNSNLDQNLYYEDDVAPMKLQHFYLVFVILFTGVTIAFVVLLIERFIYSKNRKHKVGVRVRRRAREVCRVRIRNRRRW